MSQAGIINVSSSSGVVGHLTGNTGGALNPDTNQNFNIVTANSTPIFAGSGSTLTLDFGLSNLALGSSLPSLSTGTGNVGLGSNALRAITTGVNNVSIGFGNLEFLNTGSANTCVGYLSGSGLTTGGSNVYVGQNAGAQNSASNNVIIGTNSGNNFGGNNNVIIGNSSASSYNNIESNNVIIANIGVVGESNVTRIGTRLSQNKCFISGIDGVNVGSTAQVVTEVSGQLGTAVITAGTGISIVPTANTITIYSTSATPNYTNVTNAQSPYTVLSTDQYISVNTSTGSVTLLFPNTPTANQTWVVKDRTGNASANNISITTVGGTITIDGVTTYTISQNYGAVSILANSTPTYEIY